MLGLGLGIPLGSVIKQSPTSISDSLALWLQNGVGVATGKWEDSSGNGNDAQQGTGGNQATVTANGGLDFEETQSDHYDLDNTITVGNSSAFCLAIVLNQETATNNTILSKTGNEVISIKDAQTIEFKTNGNGNVTSELVVPNGTFTASQKLLIVLNKDRNGAFSIFQNGSAVTIDPDNSTNHTEGDNHGGFTLKVVGANAGSSNFFDGEILDLAFWNGELTTTEIADVNSFFTSYHGI